MRDMRAALESERQKDGNEKRIKNLENELSAAERTEVRLRKELMSLEERIAEAKETVEAELALRHQEELAAQSEKCRADLEVRRRANGNTTRKSRILNFCRIQPCAAVAERRGNEGR